MKTPINSRTLRQHFTYNWWKYLVAVIAAFFVVDLYYTVTTYRAPEDKKIDLYISGVVDDSFEDYLESVRAESLPDMEEITYITLTLDDTYGPMQLSTYIAAGEGDIYILPRDNFVSLASQTAWVPLEDETELMNLFDTLGTSLQSGWRRDSDSGETHLYGIPMSVLPGASKYMTTDSAYLCILVTNGNTENVLKFLKIFCEDMIE